MKGTAKCLRTFQCVSTVFRNISQFFFLNDRQAIFLDRGFEGHFMCNGTISATASANHYFSLDTFNLTPPHTGVRIVSVCSNGFRSRRVSVLRCTRTGLFVLGIGSGSSNRVSVDPELEIEPEHGREGLVPMRLVELRVAQSLGPKRPRNGRVPGRFCT